MRGYLPFTTEEATPAQRDSNNINAHYRYPLLSQAYAVWL